MRSSNSEVSHKLNDGPSAMTTRAEEQQVVSPSLAARREANNLISMMSERKVNKNLPERIHNQCQGLPILSLSRDIDAMDAIRQGECNPSHW
jgi:hypothetical protein